MRREQPASITPYPDGPLIVRGDIRLLTSEGEEIVPSRKTVALCRCGVSTIKPYCDGTHKLLGFRTSPPTRDECPAAAAESEATDPLRDGR